MLLDADFFEASLAFDFFEVLLGDLPETDLFCDFFEYLADDDLFDPLLDSLPLESSDGLSSAGIGGASSIET